MKHKHLYTRRRFWIGIFVLLIIVFVGVVNWDLNKPEYQKKLADYIYAKTQTQLEFNNIRFNLFWGSIKGEALSLRNDKTKFSLTLKDLQIKYTPFFLWIGHLRITGVEAKELTLDTSQLVKTDKTKKQIEIPKFLTHVNLNKATIDKFIWLQAPENKLTIDSIRLKATAHSLLVDNPLQMVLEDLCYQTNKVELRAGRIDLNGLFTFDLSQPRIFDESNFTVLTSASQILVAIKRKPKPWLNDRAWDEDLEPILARYFDDIPTDRSYFFIDSVSAGIKKSPQTILLNSFKLNYANAQLSGQATWQIDKHDFGLRLKTDTPLSISKLPLGQSKFRRAFQNFTLDTLVKGKFEDIAKHDLNVTVEAALVGNNVREGGGDINAKISGRLVNQQLTTNLLNVALLDGSLSGNAKLNLKDLTTNTSFAANNLDAQTIVRLFSTVNVPSSVQATGSVTGKLNNPHLSLNMTTNNAAYEFLNFGSAQGSLTIDNKNLKFNVQTQNSPVGSASLSMDAKNVFNPFEVFLQLKSNYANISFKQLVASRRLDATLGGSFDLQRSKGKVKANGDIVAKGFSAFDQNIGDVSFKVGINDKHADFKPITITVPETQKIYATGQGLAFDFDQNGYTFKGSLVSELPITGTFQKANKSVLHLNLNPNNFNLELIQPLIPIMMKTSSVTGKMDLDYNIKDPLLSHLNSSWSKIDIETTEGLIHLNRSGVIDYQDQAIIFRNLDLTVGDGRVTLNGPLGFANNSALQVKGGVDFAPLTDFNPFISESDKPIEMDVTLKGNIFSPQVFGHINLKDDTVRFREMEADLEHMNGTLKCDGTRFSVDQLSLEFDDGLTNLSGWITTNFKFVTGANLKIQGQEIPLHLFSGLTLLSDVDLTLTGNGTLTLAGKMNIVEGLYQRNFTVTDYIIRPSEDNLDEAKETLAGLPLNTNYKLQIKNTGDVLIKNNLAQLEVNTQLDMLGTIEHPELFGQMDFVNGRINAFGINFDEASGYAQFRKGDGVIPLVNITASREIQNYDITARIEGRTNNLRLTLGSTPALNHQEILSLVLYGQTPDQLTTDARRNLTQTAAISQLATILSNPLNQISGLDVLQVSSRRESADEFIQRLSVGKHLTNRFDLTFTTDLGIEDPERALEIRYQMLDNLYLIVAKDIVGEERYRFDVNWRFQSY